MASTAATKPASSNWELFHDSSWSFETLRALGYVVYGGADIGEVSSTASRIPDGDETAWYAEWRALAERVHADADRSDAEGHPVSARETYLRASNYYRLCEFYLRVDSSNDPEVRDVGQLSVDSFACAARLMNPAPQRVTFLFEDTTLPGWWIPADLGTAHPTGCETTKKTSFPILFPPPWPRVGAVARSRSLSARVRRSYQRVLFGRKSPSRSDEDAS
jgi:hypothetical protein